MATKLPAKEKSKIIKTLKGWKKTRGRDSIEKNYVFKYHLDVYSNISKYLNSKEKKWLASFI